MDVVIRGVHKAFDKLQALQPTDLLIRQGQFTTLLGPSGCGKTTLLRILAGLESPDSGEIMVGDECLFSSILRIDKPASRRNFGMVFQDFALWPHMTVFENIAFGLRASGNTKQLKERVQEAVRTVRLEGLEERYPHQLSGGQQQRVAFARAVITRPRLVLFDEPLSALDAMLREEMRLELLHLVKQIGLTALYVTHDQNEAMSMSDEIMVMQQGKILQRGRPEHIYSKPEHPFVARFIGKSNWLEEDKTLIRPEHVHWEKEGVSEAYHGTIHSVSYLGDRYEVLLNMGDLGMWTAYHRIRKTIGEQATVYISQEHIHHIS